ncbi:hypothetical protein [Pseudescherichia sp.]|uniref:hypothetical protein n=1 Tax=Pseudescherichia sp. TaxID=2055881 RepID=UPI002896A3A9|nr:hypothetical protein [Pseudescherichia sp.]
MNVTEIDNVFHCDCSFSWQRGKSGAHDCTVGLRAQRDQLAAENAGIKKSRAILAENTLEACNAIASAGFSHEAIMRGLYASTGNGNKYPKPITALVDEALREVETPATDSWQREQMARGVDAAIAHAFKDGVPDDRMQFIARMTYFAAQLRNGEAV